MAWQGTYARVKAHFFYIPKKGVDPCPNELKRCEALRDQERDDGKDYNMNSSHASTVGVTIATTNQKDKQRQMCLLEM